ncbi:hypothetical protein JCM15765_14500 [Paradesulfitobacterium aromaticivorans]
MEGYVILENLEDLRARLRKRQDRDIRQALRRLGQLEQGELSDLIRDGVRHELIKKGVFHVLNSLTNCDKFLSITSDIINE